MIDEERQIRILENVSSAGLMLIPFIVIFVLLMFLTPFTQSQMNSADPLIQAFNAWNGIVVIPILSVIVCVGLLLIQIPSRIALKLALRKSILGILFALALFLILRVVLGETMPDFIPPEESAKPGILLGLGAGLIEEVIFRLMILPFVFIILSSRMKKNPIAMVIAILLTGLLFAIAHEIGPGAIQFRLTLFITRIVAGSFMSILFFWPGPSFAVSWHCSAHIFLPFLFK